MAPVIASFQGVLLGWTLTFLSVFLILLILVQRGRGGGLTGALGGPGGQSAFGTKAGDMFTKITSVTALIWIFLCAYTMWLYNAPAPTADEARRSEVVAPADDEDSTQRSSNALDDLISGESDADNEPAGGPTDPDTPAADEADSSDATPAEAAENADEE